MGQGCRPPWSSLLFLPSVAGCRLVFAPADEAFTDSVQPGPIFLHYHLLPVAFPLRSLKSLPFGAKIASLLTVTTLPADRLVSLINRFFDQYFRISGPILSYGGYGSKNLCCLVTMLTVFAPVNQAMMSRIGKRKERQREREERQRVGRERRERVPIAVFDFADVGGVDGEDVY